ncbi:hypothetical protein MTR67_023038 [Solanum verrucosum]|uniref:Uncharacterized protein n=1 Tax=Solanum verrucosum TaxID=315347 RepID=A0AAF0QUK2_SOLVR|nr:hypothetical protein MTR67_023038 [Solanum verrucosum]
MPTEKIKATSNWQTKDIMSQKRLLSTDSQSIKSITPTQGKIPTMENRLIDTLVQNVGVIKAIEQKFQLIRLNKFPQGSSRFQFFDHQRKEMDIISDQILESQESAQLFADALEHSSICTIKDDIVVVGKTLEVTPISHETACQLKDCNTPENARHGSHKEPPKILDESQDAALKATKSIIIHETKDPEAYSDSCPVDGSRESSLSLLKGPTKPHILTLFHGRAVRKTPREPMTYPMTPISGISMKAWFMTIKDDMVVVGKTLEVTPISHETASQLKDCNTPENARLN